LREAYHQYRQDKIGKMKNRAKRALKAGIGWEGWKDAELYVYEALVFGEK
jgi:hypothetical protein